MQYTFRYIQKCIIHRYILHSHRLEYIFDNIFILNHGLLYHNSIFYHKLHDTHDYYICYNFILYTDIYKSTVKKWPMQYWKKIQYYVQVTLDTNFLSFLTYAYNPRTQIEVYLTILIFLIFLILMFMTYMRIILIQYCMQIINNHNLSFLAIDLSPQQLLLLLALWQQSMRLE